MLVARQEVLTRSRELSVSHAGRGLKRASAALQTSTRITSLALRFAPCICTLEVTLRMFVIIQSCPRFDRFNDVQCGPVLQQDFINYADTER